MLIGFVMENLLHDIFVRFRVHLHDLLLFLLLANKSTLSYMNRVAPFLLCHLPAKTFRRVWNCVWFIYEVIAKFIDTLTHTLTDTWEIKLNREGAIIASFVTGNLYYDISKICNDYCLVHLIKSLHHRRLKVFVFHICRYSCFFFCHRRRRLRCCCFSYQLNDVNELKHKKHY